MGNANGNGEENGKKEPGITYRDYIESNEEYLGMCNAIWRYLEIDISIVNYALFACNFRSIAAAMDKIYETEMHSDGRDLMMHPFVGYLPNTEQFNKIGQGDDLERGDLDKFKICYICQREAQMH